MDAGEFSREFDLLYNNIMSNAAVPVTEYEKSLFLTRAQEELIKYYFGMDRDSQPSSGFDSTIKRISDFSGIISTTVLNVSADDVRGANLCHLVRNPNASSSDRSSMDKRSYVILMPENLMFPINDDVLIYNRTSLSSYHLQVLPIRYDNYLRMMSKPYKEPLKWQVWKLVGNGGYSSSMVELIPHSNESIMEYTLRYVRKPYPIILVNLNSEYEGVSIDGYSSPYRSDGTVCELNPEIHREIISRAVELAKLAYQSEQNTEGYADKKK